MPSPSSPSVAETVRPMMATAIAFIILNTVFLVLRFYTVLFLRSKRLPLKWDDYFLIPAYLGVLSISVLALVMHHYETAGNPPYAPNEEILVHWRIVPILKSIWTMLIFLSVSYACTRYSILIFYLRVFSGRRIRLLSWAFIALITAQALAFIVASIVQCHPVAYYWDRGIEGGGACFDVDEFNKSFTPVNIAFDVVILLMPLPSIWRFETTTLRKVGYTAVLGMGSFALAASIIRAVVLEQNSTVVITPELSNLEITWLVVEPSLYFITVCMPAMYPAVPALLALFTATCAAPRTVRRRRLDAGQDRISRRHRGKPSQNRFSRLADEATTATTAATLSTSKSGEGSVLNLTPADSHDIGTRSRAQTDMAPVPSMSMQALEGGGVGKGGILVHTEVTVTQEERMGDIVGF